MIVIVRPLTKTGRYAPKTIAADKAPKADTTMLGNIAEISVKSESGETLLIRIDAATIDRLHALVHSATPMTITEESELTPTRRVKRARKKLTATAKSSTESTTGTKKKRGPGRPKGSKNKVKKEEKDTSRMVTI